MSLEIESYLLGKKAGGGGGGNPNTTETYTGTVADVLVNIPDEKLEIMADTLELDSVNASAFIRIDANALGMGSFTQRFFAYGVIFQTNGAGIGTDSSLANDISWRADGSLIFAYIEQDGTITDLSPYASMVEATITYCYHPMPSA